jgi:hypothetical protein
MKTLVEQAIGGDGAKAGAYIDNGNLELRVAYPLAKVVEPVNKIIDGAIDRLEAAVPGDWDKALLEPIRAEAKAALVALLSAV